jgi:uncharacterized membrane protein YfcA
VLIGSLAQLINGTLGMGFGVSSTTALVTIGVLPVVASASVHTAQIFTALVSGSAHLKFGNVDRNMAMRLVIPGIFGGVTGAYVLTKVSGGSLSAIVGVILFIMGFMIFFKFALRNTVHFRTKTPSSKMLLPLGYAAAFTDAIGGGGWGPVATTTLVASNVKPNEAIGSVNFAKFFVTTAETVAFILLLGLENFNWPIVIGLIIGGLICAPVSTWLTRKLPHKVLGGFVGIVVMILSVLMILKFVGMI